LLLPHLKSIRNRRAAAKPPVTPREQIQMVETELSTKYMVLSEVKEIIELPEFDECRDQDSSTSATDLDDQVKKQLRRYIHLLASMYEDNAFHCFEHATHVAMAMVCISFHVAFLFCQNPLLLTDDVIFDHCSTFRYVGQEPFPYCCSQAGNYPKGPPRSYVSFASYSCLPPCQLLVALSHIQLLLFACSYGITSDPLTQFAVILAALMHDTDHQGVPNGILVAENPTLGVCYQNKSVAEQNSVDLAFSEYILCPNWLLWQTHVLSIF
jgi:hypothetical protein